MTSDEIIGLIFCALLSYFDIIVQIILSEVNIYVECFRCYVECFRCYVECFRCYGKTCLFLLWQRARVRTRRSLCHPAHPRWSPTPTVTMTTAPGPSTSLSSTDRSVAFRRYRRFRKQECIPVGCLPPGHYLYCGVSLDKDPSRQRPPLTETPSPLDRDPPWTKTTSGQRPPLDRDPQDRNPSEQRHPWTETPGQRPPGQRPLRQRPSGQRPPPPVDRQTPVKTLPSQTSFTHGNNKNLNIWHLLYKIGIEVSSKVLAKIKVASSENWTHNWPSLVSKSDAYPSVLVCHALSVSDFHILIKSCSIESRNDQS